jgi:hypothetical protein
MELVVIHLKTNNCLKIGMPGTMNGWMDGWPDRWNDGWMYGLMDGKRNVCMNR